MAQLLQLVKSAPTILTPVTIEASELVYTKLPAGGAL